MAEGMQLKTITEALITAAQDQALNTKYHQAQIFGINEDSKCLMCKKTNETVSHILNMCKKLTTNNYLKRHNNVAAIIHRNICQHYVIQACKTPWKHHPEPVAENKEVKVLLD